MCSNYRTWRDYSEIKQTNIIIEARALWREAKVVERNRVHVPWVEHQGTLAMRYKIKIDH